MHHRSATDTAWLVVDATIGLTVEAARAGSRVGGTLARTLRPVTDLAARPPLVPERYRPAHLLRDLADVGYARRRVALRAALDAFRRSVPVVAAEILDQLDLTELIRVRIDLDTLVAAVDVNAVVARADLDAVVARLDLIALARHVAAGMDLPGSIRESTGSVTATAQSGGTETDSEAVAEWVDRVFRARRPEAEDDPDQLTDPG